jgi:predicted signal transduction protein with EAL and GGDEF domain
MVVFITPAIQRDQSLERLKNLIRITFREPSHFSEEGAFGAAVGISVFPLCAKSSNMLVQTADIAMYQAKRNAKAGVESLVFVEYNEDLSKGNDYTICPPSHSLAV